MTGKKYKLNDIAKDLNVPAKEVASFLAGHFGGEPKKSGAALTESEANVVFEHYTSLHQVDSFNPYFATRDEKPEEPKSSPVDKAKAALKGVAEKLKPAAKPAKKAEKAEESGKERADKRKPCGSRTF